MPSKAPFGVNEKRFLSLYKNNSPLKFYNIKYPDCKITSFIYPPFNTTSERFMFNKESFIKDFNHTFYFSSNFNKRSERNEECLRIVGTRLFI
jgi:hypothetical protein